MFDLPNSEDYYKPRIVDGAFNSNYIQYESKENKDKISDIRECLDLIRPYLVDMINDHKNNGEYKIQLTAAINFISSKPDSEETRTIYTESNNIEIMIGSDTDDVIEEVLNSLLQRYQENLKEKMGGSEFVFDAVNVMYYDLNKISLNRGGSYIPTNTVSWLSDKKATVNPQNKKDDRCFKYALTVALNYEKIKNNSERISKINPFIDQYNWKEIDFPSKGKDWKKFDQIKNQLLLIFCMYLITLKNMSCVYLEVKKLSALLKEITSNHNGDFYCLNCFHTYRTKNKRM